MMHQSTKLPNHSSPRQRFYNALRSFLPTPGNIFFMVLLIGLTLVGQDVFGRSADLSQAEAATASVGTKIPYQAYITDEDSKPLDGDYNMTFRLYTQLSGGTAIWTEQHNSGNQVAITDGLLTVQLGTLNAISREVIVNSRNLYLGISVDGEDEMTPRVEMNNTAQIEPRICCGSTPTDGSGWTNYGNENGISIQVDTSECQFSSRTKYFSSLNGRVWHWQMVGSNAIYNKRPDSFKIFLRGTNGVQIRRERAMDGGWHIEWCGIEE